MLNKFTSIIVQTTVWLVLFGFLLFMGGQFNTWITALYKAALIIGLLVILTYVNAFVLIPKLFNSQWIIIYFITISCLILFSIYISNNFIFKDYTDIKITMFNKLNNQKKVVDGSILFQPLILILSISSFFISSIVVLIKEINTQKRKQLEIEIEKKSSELKILSSQFSPHFLLNSLNNLYSISKLKPHKVSEHIERLSSLLTNIIYEHKDEKITIEKEIDFIENYTYFQQEKADDLFEVTKNFEQVDKLLQIEPRLLIPFVENAFKYAYHPSKTMKVDLSMESDGNEFHFKISNDISNYERREKEDGYFGVGIDSVKQLLENQYPNKHQLEITDRDRKYTVSLKIYLPK